MPRFLASATGLSQNLEVKTEPKYSQDGWHVQKYRPSAQKAGAIVRAESLSPAQLASGACYALSALMHEKRISTNTAAAGGNAQLMTMG
jgi:RHH-type proline utilization regulon transcriptional repressor/proline dehydrogenase/delta 1-pyrroline-5-carboxylate dehydrogenase